jgi:hypothetical protein
VNDLMRRAGEKRKLQVLRARLESGADAIARGDFFEVDDSDLEAYLEELKFTQRENSR